MPDPNGELKFSFCICMAQNDCQNDFACAIAQLSLNNMPTTSIIIFLNK